MGKWRNLYDAIHAEAMLTTMRGCCWRYEW